MIRRLAVAFLFFVTLNLQTGTVIIPRAYLPAIRVAGRPAPPVVPLVANPSFEGSTGRDVLWWDPSGGPYTTPFGETSSPEDWTVWWHDRQPDVCPPNVTGRPETGLILAHQDRLRIRTGEKAAKLFTFWRCHRYGLLQSLQFPPGKFIFKIYAQAWFSRCSNRPHSPPLEPDCKTPLWWASMRVRVGIDPTGSQDPSSSSIAWSTWTQPYAQYMLLSTPPVVFSQAGTATLFVESRSTAPIKHQDLYLDDASIEATP